MLARSLLYAVLVVGLLVYGLVAGNAASDCELTVPGFGLQGHLVAEVEDGYMYMAKLEWEALIEGVQIVPLDNPKSGHVTVALLNFPVSGREMLVVLEISPLEAGGAKVCAYFPSEALLKHMENDER